MTEELIAVASRNNVQDKDLVTTHEPRGKYFLSENGRIHVVNVQWPTS